MKVITVISAKGGVGKTTLAANLASVMATQQQRVLAIDLDPSNTLRLHFGVSLNNIAGLSHAALANTSWQGATIAGSGHVTVLPFGTLGEDDQKRFERHIRHDSMWLARGLETLQLFSSDIVIIDTPPGSSIYTRTSISIANFLLDVICANAASYVSIPNTQSMISEYALPRNDFMGVGHVVNQVDQSRRLNKDVLSVLRHTLGPQLFPMVIHLDEGVNEALACNTTLMHYDPACQAATDLRSCGKWLLHLLDEGMHAHRGAE
ncbi:cellulose synthase operon protein YhjQ [Burkholderia sp. Bp9126]|nr:cellulose synthase operon protein YhjQ [Burkholderia sp. Bp9126]